MVRDGTVWYGSSPGGGGGWGRKVSWARRRLLENGKIARATHNIAAWRVWDEGRGVQLHDNDDDGEGNEVRYRYGEGTSTAL